VTKSVNNIYARPAFLGGASLIVTALLAAPVNAQDNSEGTQILASLEDQSGPSAESGESKDIVVTARRRDENAQDVPIALSVVGAETLEATGNFSLGQVQQLVPSLQVFSFNPRNTNVNIRGLGSNVALTNDGLENGVGIYIDNVYYGRVGQSQFDLVDLQQIEVLRGPQGTLFGKNTTAGAINITTRAPSFDPEFSGEATLGDHGYHQLRGSLSAPLIGESVAFRLSIADTHRDGFLTNIYDGSEAQDYDNFTARGQLLIKPSTDISIKLIGDYSSQRQNYVLNVLGNYFGTYDNGAAIPNNFVDRVTRAGYTPLPFKPFDRLGDSDSHYQANMKGYGLSGQLDWDLGGAALTSITAYRWWDWDPANDGDSTSLPVITKAQQANRQRQFSQEVRIASTGARTIDYVVGVYYFWQIIRGYGATAYGAAAANWNLPAVPAAVGDAALNGFQADSTSTPETKSYAAFGQATWNATDALKLTVGLRYTHEKKQGEYHQYHVAGADLSTLPTAIATPAAAIRTLFNPVTDLSTSFTDNSLSGLVNLSYAVAPDVLVYASYSRGNKSGGLNLVALPAGVDPQVRPEKVDAFELGLKSQFLDRRVTLNLAGYWTEISDYQTAITEQVANTVNFRQYIANIPKVRSRGVEADLIYAPTRLISFSAAASYTDATYLDYRNAPQAPENLNLSGIQDLTGERLAGVPEFTYTLGADLAQPVSSWGARDVELYGHADFSHRSSFNTSSSNSRYADVPGYGVLNARIGVRTDDARWDVSVWARNLTDADYFQTLSAGNTGLVTALIGEPRTWGVTLRTKL
jgi:iron complex outermembrane receptor protein